MWDNLGTAIAVLVLLVLCLMVLIAISSEAGGDGFLFSWFDSAANESFGLLN